MTSSSTSPSAIITPHDLARALNKMGLTESVSAALLYDTIVQLKSDSKTFPLQPLQITPNPPQAQIATDCQKADQAREFNTATPSLDFHDPVRVEKRRIMRERVKAQWPNGPPPLIGLYGEKWSGGDMDVQDNHGSSE